jgi:Tol biopolymer transport system component
MECEAYPVATGVLIVEVTCRLIPLRSALSSERFLIFTANGDTGGKTSPDLFVRYKDENGRWLKAENLGAPINSEANELSPMLSPDGKYLFYISTRDGNMDVYWVDARFLRRFNPERH